MIKTGLTLLTVFFLLSCVHQEPTPKLNNEIENVVKNKKAEIGVAILGIENGELFSYNGSKRFPMQSVYKFHLALAVFNKVDEGKLALQQPVELNENNLLPGTWSPLRDKYAGADTAVTLIEIVRSTVSESDNNGCDILFGMLGGPDSVNRFFKQEGMDDISIVATELEMHQDWNVQFENWTTPLAAVQLLEKFYRGQLISDSSTIKLMKMLLESNTSPFRIKGGLPEGCLVAHKTGSSGQNEKGITAALNDIGIVTLPDGNHFAIAVFVSNSFEDKEVNEKIISDISLAAYNYFNNGK